MRAKPTLLAIGLMALLIPGCHGPTTGPKVSASSFRVADRFPSDSWSKGGDPIVPCQEVRRRLHDAYELPVLMVVTSAAEWRAYQQKVLDQGGLLVGPPEPPPSSVNWDREAVLLVGMRDRGAAFAPQITGLARRGSRLRANVEIDWSRPLDAVEYSPSDMVKFTKWRRLAGSCHIGAEQVVEGLRQMRLAGL